MAADDRLLVEAWNARASPNGLRGVRGLDAERRAKLGRLRKEYDQPTLLEAVGIAGASGFCCGQGDRGWRAGFDWFLRPASVRALLEGAYAERVAPLVGERAAAKARGFAAAGRALQEELLSTEGGSG